MLRSSVVAVLLACLACAPSATTAPSDLACKDALPARQAELTPPPPGPRAPGQTFNRTRFCVDTTGATTDIQTLVSTGNPAVDQIVRNTVAGWHFKPFVCDGQPQVTCSEAEFNITIK